MCTHTCLCVISLKANHRASFFLIIVALSIYHFLLIYIWPSSATYWTVPYFLNSLIGISVSKDWKIRPRVNCDHSDPWYISEKEVWKYFYDEKDGFVSSGVCVWERESGGWGVGTFCFENWMQSVVKKHYVWGPAGAPT